LQKGGIYRHFASKEELAAEAFDYIWGAVWKSRQADVDAQAGGLEKLKQFIANFVEHRSPVAGGCPVLNTAVDADDGNAVLRSRVAKALRTWVELLASFVAEAQEKGAARGDVEPKAVATLVVASLEGALMMSRIQLSEEPLRQIQVHLNGHLDREVAVQV
jgi:TetR/AcrR family transcriptional repressor of nem operon